VHKTVVYMCKISPFAVIKRCNKQADKAVYRQTRYMALTRTVYPKLCLDKLWQIYHSAGDQVVNKDIARLHPQSTRHFEWQPSVRVSQTLESSYLSHIIAATA